MFSATKAVISDVLDQSSGLMPRGGGGGGGLPYERGGDAPRKF